jgi:hypothetical protein
MIVAIATALQESGLQNLGHGGRDSLGLFQQRPSQGWGTAQQVRDPRYAALSFYGGHTSPHFNAATGKASPAGLLDVAKWADLPVSVAAQAVQRSAFPGAYAKHEARATLIVDALAGDAPSNHGSEHVDHCGGARGRDCRRLLSGGCRHRLVLLGELRARLSVEPCR